VKHEEEQMSRYATTLDAWRSAAEIAGYRWHQFSQADRDARPFMFAAYAAALNREEAAAAELALMTFDRAAA
jgi:hypothetical protein